MSGTAKYFNLIWHKYLKIDLGLDFCIPEEVEKNLVSLMYVDLNFMCMSCVDPYFSLKYEVA